MAQANAGGNVQGLAVLIFTQYLWAFELTSALLITAALGAMVLAHRERFERRKTQRELAHERFLPGGHPTTLPNPGVYARNNAVDIAARLPDGSALRAVRQRASCRANVNRPTAARRRMNGGEEHNESRQLPVPVRAAVHDRRVRSAVAPQRHRHVHVRRADAERRATWPS